MKIVFLLSVALICTLLVQAQEKPDKLPTIPFGEINPEQHGNPFDSSPQFKLPDPEAPAFPDSLFEKPGNGMWAEGVANDVTDYFHMPVAKPGTQFSSNMPVMVPDSSVNYHILQKKLDLKMLPPEVNE